MGKYLSTLVAIIFSLSLVAMERPEGTNLNSAFEDALITNTVSFTEAKEPDDENSQPKIKRGLSIPFLDEAREILQEEHITDEFLRSCKAKNAIQIALMHDNGIPINSDLYQEACRLIPLGLKITEENGRIHYDEFYEEIAMWVIGLTPYNPPDAPKKLLSGFVRDGLDKARGADVFKFLKLTFNYKNYWNRETFVTKANEILRDELTAIAALEVEESLKNLQSDFVKLALWKGSQEAFGIAHGIVLKLITHDFENCSFDATDYISEMIRREDSNPSAKKVILETMDYYYKQARVITDAAYKKLVITYMHDDILADCKTYKVKVPRQLKKEILALYKESKSL